MKKVPCEVYTRIVGYYRPVSNWNAGKQREYKERVEFSEKTSMASSCACSRNEPMLLSKAA